MKKCFSLLFIFCSLSVYSQTTAPGNFILSIGAAKQRFNSSLFDKAATYSFPVSTEILFTKMLSFGIKGAPMFINNRSNSYMDNNNPTTRFHNSGYLLFGLGSLNYYAYNIDRLLWKIGVEAGYGIMDKIKFDNDKRYQKKAEGLNYGVLTCVRYHLGDDYDDVYPTYFELGMGYNWFKMKVNESTIDFVPTSTIADWQPIKYSNLDVFLTFGYRFGKTIKSNE